VSSGSPQALCGLPAIHAGLGGSGATLNWTVNGYTLPFAAGIIAATGPDASLSESVTVRRPCVDAKHASSEPSVRRLA
jgi:hypothetical protein